MPKKILKGKVVSDKMEKTIVVAVDMPKKHALYSKIIKNTRRFKARDENGAKIGDVVTIEEHAPFSKEVTWEVKEILTKEEE